MASTVLPPHHSVPLPHHANPIDNYQVDTVIRIDIVRESIEMGTVGNTMIKCSYLQNSSGNLSSTNSTLDISSSTQQSPNCVLRVIIENMLYPVTLEILYNVS